MGLDDEPDHEGPLPDGLLPPDDRLWRHPSELGSGPGLAGGVTALGFTHPVRTDRKGTQLGALAGACLAGAVVAFGAMWLTRPTRVEHVPTNRVHSSVSSLVAPLTIATAPIRRPAVDLSAQVALLQVQRDGVWTSSSALWVDDNGTLATSAPTIDGASALVVTGADGTRQTARSVGQDPVTAIAVLEVERTSGEPMAQAPGGPHAGLAAALVGAPDASVGTRVHEASVASVTIRVTSTRTSVGGYLLHDAVQLDRATPSDMVGGALIDAQGRLLGLVIGNSTDQDLGTAVRASTVQQVATDLRDHGRVRRAWLGIRAIDLDPARGEQLQVSGGAQLTQITPSSPAAAADLEVGDVVVAIDQVPVGDASDLVVLLGRHHGGDRVQLDLRRQGVPTLVTVTLAG